MDFLYKAELERTKAENGVDDDTQNELNSMKNNMPSGMRSQSAPKPGSPPVGGNTRSF